MFVSRKINRFEVNTLYGTQYLLYHSFVFISIFHLVILLGLYLLQERQQNYSDSWLSDKFSEFNDDSNADLNIILGSIVWLIIYFL